MVLGEWVHRSDAFTDEASNSSRSVIRDFASRGLIDMYWKWVCTIGAGTTTTSHSSVDAHHHNVRTGMQYLYLREKCARGRVCDDFFR